MKTVQWLAILLLIPSAWSSIVLAQSWTPLTHSAPATIGVALLLHDGGVLAKSEFTNLQNWFILTPDNKGSYVNGTWTQAASLPAGYAPLYAGSAVLPDGRVLLEGGEYNLSNQDWTTLGAIYDPAANTWTNVNPPSGWTKIGDAQTVVLANGTLMLADCCDGPPYLSALFNASTLTWTPTGANKSDFYVEEGFTLLPNGKVLDIDAYVFLNDPTGTNSELYDPSTGSWSSAGSTIQQLWDECGGTGEEGPDILMPNGTGVRMAAALGTRQSTTWPMAPGPWDRIFKTATTSPMDLGRLRLTARP